MSSKFPRFDHSRSAGEIYGTIGHVGYVQVHDRRICVFNLQHKFSRYEDPPKPNAATAVLPAAEDEEEQTEPAPMPDDPVPAPAEPPPVPSDGYERMPYSVIKGMAEKRGYQPRDKTDAIKFLRGQIAA